jgi:hypothetical protein
MTRLPRRSAPRTAAALVACVAALATVAQPAGPAWAGRTGTVARGMAQPGTNLLLSPGAQTGAVSRHGWDSVTIPGWQVASGLPTAVRYGTPSRKRSARRR